MDNFIIRIPLTVSQRQQTIPLGVQAGGGGTRNYNALANKPAINGHELVGDQTAAELGLATPEDIPTVPTKTSDLTNDSGFVNAAGAAAAAPVQNVNGKTGAVTLDAEDVGALPERSTLDDIPDGSTYKRTTGAQVQQISTNAAAIEHKQETINASGILKGSGSGGVSAAVAGTDYQTPLTAGTDYATPAQVNAKYSKPAGGIPVSDMSTEVQTSLGLADTALQSVPSTYRTAAAQDVIDAAQNAEIDDLHESKAPVIINTASGAIASFDDGADGLPFKTLSVNIEPVQSGAGDPSPTNIRPISGWTSATVYHSGADTRDPSVIPIAFPAAAGTVYGGTLTINEDGTGELMVTHAIVSYDKNDTWAKYYGFYAPNKVHVNSASQITNGICDYFKVRTSAAETVGFNSVSVQDGGNTYFVPRFYYDAVNTVQEWVNYLAENNKTIQVAYLLNDPILYQLTAQQITILFGTNNIWADCGDVEVTYRADTKTYVDDHSGSAAVTDVQVNGTSVVQGGVANVPLATPTVPGVITAGTITVTGTTPTITAEANTRYVCGEVATLDLTPPASGICDVVFTSGSTATVLTVPSTVKWANDFDPESLEANKTYELNICDGLGVAASWT